MGNQLVSTASASSSPHGNNIIDSSASPGAFSEASFGMSPAATAPPSSPPVGSSVLPQPSSASAGAGSAVAQATPAVGDGISSGLGGGSGGGTSSSQQQSGAGSGAGFSDTTASQRFELNPGPFDELHKRCKDCFPVCFDGAKLMLNKGLSSHFQISHTLSMSPVNNGYRFGVTYVGSKQLSASESFPVVLGETDLDGNVSATCIHQFSDKLRCKFMSQIQQNKIAATQLTGEYRSRLATSSLTVANPDLVSDSGILVGSYLRRVHPKLDLGLELVYQYGRQIPGAQISVLSYAARYLSDNFTAAGSLSSSGLHCSYYHKQRSDLQLGVEWETNLRLNESVASLGYQLELPKANATFRGSIDSQGTVSATLEKKLLPLPFTFALSGAINHSKAQSRFGIAFIAG
jgi:mitochondrial import receptor subunit TOM40